MFRKILICILTIFILSIPLVSNAELYSDDNLKDENIQLKYQIESLNGKISLLEDAISELGASTPNDAANIWAKGIKVRNGYLQYYVSCNKMQEKFKEELSKSKKTSWVTGYSSPWVSSYDIKSIEHINSLNYKFTIIFNWATSTGPKDSTKAIITVTKTNNNWCISDIELDENMKKLIF
ncbi:MAG: hypothetical protein ACRCXT_20795 [Paraclostridium sp.]